MFYDKAELAKGIKHEAEHTKDKALATKIALDHILEDPHYYSKLEKSGIDECGEIDIVAPAASSTPSVAVISIGSQSSGQAPLTSSGLGKSGAPKPLTSDKLETPTETKKVGPNKIATSKTPPLSGPSSITDTDPLNHFGGQIVSAWKGYNGS